MSNPAVLIADDNGESLDAVEAAMAMTRMPPARRSRRPDRRPPGRAAAPRRRTPSTPPGPRALTVPAMPDTRAVTVQENTGRWAAPSASLSHARSVTNPA